MGCETFSFLHISNMGSLLGMISYFFLYFSLCFFWSVGHLLFYSRPPRHHPHFGSHIRSHNSLSYSSPSFHPLVCGVSYQNLFLSGQRIKWRNPRQSHPFKAWQKCSSLSDYVGSARSRRGMDSFFMRRIKIELSLAIRYSYNHHRLLEETLSLWNFNSKFRSIGIPYWPSNRGI